ncbi:MAG: ribosomal protein S18-alanine N-acetyltransferase [Oscillospiraceae bacterium]|nr:ribosomal protein S18-alanine N-acetyltransferase [Oscillospiraceae bacterium]
MPSVERLTAQDVQALSACAALGTQCLAEGWSYDALMETAGSASGCILAALSGEGAVLGFLAANLVPPEGELLEIAVAPDCRRRGIGRQLVQALIRTLGEGQLFLEVRMSNAPAIALYEQCGFVRVGVRKRFYQHPTEDAAVMCLEIPGEQTGGGSDGI